MDDYYSEIAASELKGLADSEDYRIDLGAEECGMTREAYLAEAERQRYNEASVAAAMAQIADEDAEESPF